MNIKANESADSLFFSSAIFNSASFSVINNTGFYNHAALKNGVQFYKSYKRLL